MLLRAWCPSMCWALSARLCICVGTTSLFSPCAKRLFKSRDVTLHVRGKDV